MTSQWYCCIGPQQHGPLPFEQLQQWVAQGYVKPDDHVCQVGQQQWTAVRNVPGLLGPAAHTQPYYAPDGTGPHYPQSYGQPTSTAGFNFQTSPTSSTSSRSYSRPAKKDTTLQWGGAVFLTILTILGVASRVLRIVVRNQEATERRQVEERPQQKLYSAPKLPPTRRPR